MALDLQLLHLGWAAAPGSGGQSLAITPPPRRQDTPLGHHLSPFTQAGSGGRRVHPAAQLDGTGGRATPGEVQNHWGDRGRYESLPTPLAHRAPRTLHPWGSPPSPSHPEPPGPSPGWPLQEETVLRLLLPSP